MSREKKLIKNTAIITIGKVCTQFVSFILLPLYTAILSTDEFGVVDLFHTLTSLLLPIVTLQIEQAVFRKLIDSRNNDYETCKIISTTVITMLSQILVYTLMFLCFSRFIENKYKYFLLINVLACVCSSIFLQIVRGIGDNKTYAVGSTITAISTLIFNVIFIVFVKLGAYGMLLSSFIGNILCSLYILIVDKIYKYISVKECNREILKIMLKYSIPLIPNAISWWIFNSSDRVIVSYTLGLSQNGILAAAYKFSNVYISLYNIFNITWIESAAAHIKDPDSSQYLSKTINSAFKIFACICFLILAILPIAFDILIDNKFDLAYNQVPILMVATLLNVLVGLFSAVYVANNDTKAIAKTSIYAAIINIMIDLLLINKIGLYAASISTFLSFLFLAVYRYYDIQKYAKITLDKGIIFFMLVALVILIYGYFEHSIPISIILFIVMGLLSLLINKDIINELLKLIKERRKKDVF